MDRLPINSHDSLNLMINSIQTHALTLPYTCKRAKKRLF